MAQQKQEDKAEKLLSMKRQIDEAGSKAERIRGTIDQLEGQLKQHGCKTIEEAQKKLDQMDKELTASEKLLADGVVGLEKAYEWK